jgi:hypothetical protein
MTTLAMELCPICKGLKTIMGGGMIFHDCKNCKGSGKVPLIENEIEYLEKHKPSEDEYLKNKDAPHYQEAKAELKRLDSDITDEKAEELLDAEFGKIAKKRGRPRLNRDNNL